MRRGIAAVTIGKLRRVMFVRQIVCDDSPQKTTDVIEKRALKLAHHQRRGCVLREQRNESILDSGLVYGFLDSRSDIDELLFFFGPQSEGLPFCFHDSRVARISASM